MRILVTGSAGFIGRRLVPLLLLRGHDVVGIGRSPGNDIVLDILDEGAVSRALLDGDALVHLAWFAKPPAFWSSPENDRWATASFALVSSFLRAGGGTAIVAGSCAEYGDGSSSPYRETDPGVAATRYGEAKARLFHLLERETGWARIFFAYGRGEPEEKLVSRLCREVATGHVPELSAPDRLLDYINADDIAEGLARMVQGRITGAVNLGTGIGVSARTIARAVAADLRPELVPAIDALPTKSAHVLPIIADTTLMHAKLGTWEMVPLETGITTMTAQLRGSA